MINVSLVSSKAKTWALVHMSKRSCKEMIEEADNDNTTQIISAPNCMASPDPVAPTQASTEIKKVHTPFDDGLSTHSWYACTRRQAEGNIAIPYIYSMRLFHKM